MSTPYAVQFRLYNANTGFAMPGEPCQYAKFAGKGDATAYAIWAYANLKSPSPNMIRVYEVVYRGNVVYRAG